MVAARSRDRCASHSAPSISRGNLNLVPTDLDTPLRNVETAVSHVNTFAPFCQGYSIFRPSHALRASDPRFPEVTK